jgi:Xaa-Pro aminopeptidase
MELDQFKLERTHDALSRIGLECALFSDFYNISYLTGLTTFFENGPSPFSRGTAAALFLPGRVALVAEGPAETAQVGEWAGFCSPFQGYNFEATTPPLDNFVRSLAVTVAQEAPSSGKIGLEKNFLPAAAFEQLQAIRPHVEWVELPYDLMMNVRAVKSPAELERLRSCARLAEVGQEAVRSLVRQPGLREIEIYSLAKAAMERSVGGRFALQNALHAGLNSASPFPGMPTNYATQAGDLIISDMVPYLNGYWGDTCSTYVVGGESAITDEHRRMRQIADDAFREGFEAAKPEVTAGELDQIVRGYLERYGYTYAHHTGHGIGVSNQDEPRIIINGPTVLEAGMVIVLEPPVYQPGFGGLRLERMFLITETGAELLSHNSFDLA